MSWGLITIYTVFIISATVLIGLMGYILLMIYCTVNSDLVERYRIIREYHQRLKKN